MPIEELDLLEDERPSRVRITIVVNMEAGAWPFEEPARVAAGGTIDWVFQDLSEGDQPEIRFEDTPGPLPEPRPEDAGLPPLFDPLENRARSSNRIVGTIFRGARGRYRYQVDVVRNGQRIPLRCVPDGMGGVDVSGPPRP